MSGVEDNSKPRHKFGNHKGGMNLVDEGNIIPGAVKDIVGKVANKIVKVQFSDLLKTSAPAFLHCERTYLEGSAMDLLYSQKFLT